MCAADGFNDDDSAEGRTMNAEERAMAQALRAAWPIPPEKREECVREMIRIALDRSYKPRTQAAACKVLAAFDHLNLAQQVADRKEPDRVAIELKDLAKLLKTANDEHDSRAQDS